MDLTKEEILTLFKKVAIPASVGTFFQTMYNIVDTYFAGKISPESLSALAKSFPLYFLIIATGIGLSVAQAFAAEGAAVALADISGEESRKQSLDISEKFWCKRHWCGV